MARMRWSSVKGSSKFLRKHRKWPHSPFKTKWHRYFPQQQAMETLVRRCSTHPLPLESQRQSFYNRISTTKPDLLSTLVDSFDSYNCDPTPKAYKFLIKTLIESHRFHLIPPVLDRLEFVEKFETPEYVFTDIIKSYGERNEIQNAVDVFYRIPKFRCAPTAYSLNALLSFICRSKQGIKMVPEILLYSQQMKIRVEESSFRILIAALCRMRKVGYAVEILMYVMSSDSAVDGKMCSLILSSLCKQKDMPVVEVKLFFDEMRKLGFCPGPVDYASLIRSLVKAGSGMDALDMLNQMKFDGIKPDIFCYTMTLDGVVEEGDFEMADKLFDELLVLGLVPDIYTYNVYIKGLCKQKKADQGFKMVGYMEGLGCKPNLVTYNILLDGLCKAGELERGKELLKEMESKGVLLNLRTHNILLDGWIAKGEIIEACNLLQEMLDKYDNLQSQAIDKTFCHLCQKGLALTALELLAKMVSRDIAPGARSWEALLQCCVDSAGIAETKFNNLLDSVEANGKWSSMVP